jgi:uncharacterized membrane protein
MHDTLHWLSFGGSVLLLLAYEARVLVQGKQHPEEVARLAHAKLRSQWVLALSNRPGSEITAIQALRNSLMSATISASTAALALMGTVSLSTTAVAAGVQNVPENGLPPLRLVLDILLAGVLFASYVCSAMAMRYFNHAGYVMSMPVDSADRQRLNPVAMQFVARAGLLYGWGLRGFLLIAPLVVGLVSPPIMLPMTIILVWVLRQSDKPAEWPLEGPTAGPDA